MAEDQLHQNGETAGKQLSASDGPQASGVTSESFLPGPNGLQNAPPDRAETVEKTQALSPSPESLAAYGQAKEIVAGESPSSGAQHTQPAAPGAPTTPPNQTEDAGGLPEGGQSGEDRPRRRILIGSQRDPAQYRPKPVGEGVRLVGFRRPRHRRFRPGEKPPQEPESPAEDPGKDVSLAAGQRAVAEETLSVAGIASDSSPTKASTGGTQPVDQLTSALEGSPAARAEAHADAEVAAAAIPPASAEPPAAAASAGVTPSEGPTASGAESLMWQAISDSLPSLATLPTTATEMPPMAGPGFPPPKGSAKLPAELESELEAALAGFSMDEALQATPPLPRERLPEDALVDARVVSLHEDKVFVDLGVREQGFLALKETDTPPEVGNTLRVRIVRFDPENSIYEVALPAQATDVAAWEELKVGTLVEARVTGVNAGGLECEVGHIRGFIPMSQIALYRVSNLEEYVGQRLICVVVEANRERRNLVLSRRAAIEREQEAQREALWAKLEPGQVYEGLVRKLMDFGAFVDIGGVDGLLHISQISWGRISHPSQVLQEGQRIKVKILSVDRTTRRISLAYRDLVGDPWETVDAKYPPNTVVHGRVTKIMPYGAFVELEPGVEGLIHISELAWKKVWRVSDAVQEGQEVDAVVLSVDRQARRISLSMKHLTPPPEEKAAQPEESVATEVEAPGVAVEEAPAAPKEAEAAGSQAPQAEAETASQPKKKSKPERPLKGGLGPSPLGNPFGLRW